jgi:hypothetical protein
LPDTEDLQSHFVPAYQDWIKRPAILSVEGGGNDASAIHSIPVGDLMGNDAVKMIDERGDALLLLDWELAKRGSGMANGSRSLIAEPSL